MNQMNDPDAAAATVAKYSLFLNFHFHIRFYILHENGIQTSIRGFFLFLANIF